MRQLIFANISLINLKGMYNYIEECVYISVCVCEIQIIMYQKYSQ